MIKGIIFDLDGTLIDSMDVWYDVDRRFLRENGVTDPPEDISEQMKKLTIDEAANHFISQFGLDRKPDEVISRIEEMVRDEYENSIGLKPEVAELLDWLDERGIPYGIATATYKALAEAVLKRCGIAGRFRFILTDREYPAGKNFPDIFIGGAERLGCTTEETLVVEDSLHCIETAVNAGFPTAAVYDRSAEPDAEKIKETASYYFDSIDKIKDIL